MAEMSITKVYKRRKYEKDGVVAEKRIPKRRKVKVVFNNEWDQVQDFWRSSCRFVMQKMDKIVLEVTVEGLELERNSILPPKEMDLITDSVLILDRNQIPLLYFLKGCLGWPFEKKDPCRVAVKALTNLVEHYKPPLTGKTDIRHKNKIHENGQGVYHFALWHGQGQEKNMKTHDRRTRGAVMSSNIFCTRDTLNNSIEFLHDFTPFTKAVGALFEVIDKNAYVKCKDRFESLSKNTALSTIHTTSRNCFLCMAVLVGLCCSLHTDKKDSEDSWIADLAFRNFTGSYLEVPQIGLKFNLREGDVVFMRSTLLHHAMSPMEGNRFGVVYFTHESVDE